MATFGPTKRNNLRDTQLNVLTWGDPAAAPVLLLHGLTSNAYRWEDLAGRAGEDYYLIAPDARGHGDSSAPDYGYDAPTMLRDVLSVLDALAVERAAVMGHSMGGRLGIGLAAEAPERVARLAVVDVGVQVEATGARRILDSITSAPARFDSLEAAWSYITAVRPAYSPQEIERRLRHNLRPTASGGYEWKYDARAVGEIYRLARQIDLDEYASRVTCPTLLIWGEASELLSRETAQHTADRLHAELAPIPNGSHNLMGEQPEVFASVVLRFLQPWRDERQASAG